MVNILYAVASFTCALVCLILPFKIRRQLKSGSRVERVFYMLNCWTVLFCLSDGVWGVTASDVIMNDTLLFVMSCVFHTLAALTPAMWLYFVITYLGTGKARRVYMYLMALIIGVELVLIVINIPQKILFYVNEDGVYSTNALRKLLFYMQYSTYVIIAVISIINRIKEPGVHNHTAVLIFVMSPILCGVFQMWYPDAPAYSIGYTLGVCVIYSFVLTDMLHKRILESAKAAAASEAKTSFLFNMSHDIRTPMNAIIGFTNIAAKNLDNRQKLEDCIDKIQESGGLLLSLINSILDMSRIESGKAKLNETPADMRKCFASLNATLSQQAASNDIELTMNVGKISDPYVYVDRDRFNRILINIIANGIKYTRPGGYVHAACCQQGRDDGRGIYVISVNDNGIGMSQEFQKHVFEEFSREESSQATGIQGTGLGLSLCKSFVSLMGGTISCQSEQGKGTTFTVTLPLKISADEQHEDYADAKAELDFGGRRVLMAEDNELNREIARDILEEKKLIVETAENGAEAVELIKQKGSAYYDFILMDIQMPVLNGYEATRKIRTLFPDLRAPIIALSANAFQEDIEASLNAGMNGHVAKPININELFKCLARFI